MKKFYIALSSESLQEKEMIEVLRSGKGILKNLFAYTHLAVAIFNIPNLAYCPFKYLFEIEVKDNKHVPTPCKYSSLVIEVEDVRELCDYTVSEILQNEFTNCNFPEEIYTIIGSHLDRMVRYRDCYSRLINSIKGINYTEHFLALHEGDIAYPHVITEDSFSVTDLPKSQMKSQMPVTVNPLEILYAYSVHECRGEVSLIMPGSYGRKTFNKGKANEYQTYCVPGPEYAFNNAVSLPIKDIIDKVENLLPYLGLGYRAMESDIAVPSMLSELGQDKSVITRWFELLDECNIYTEDGTKEFMKKLLIPILVEITCDDIYERASKSQYTVDQLQAYDNEFRNAREYKVYGIKTVDLSDGKDVVVITIVATGDTDVIVRHLTLNCEELCGEILAKANTFDECNSFIFFNELYMHLSESCCTLEKDIKKLKSADFCDELLEIINTPI